MSPNSSVVSLTFSFLKVEERPLQEGSKAAILTFFLLIVLVVGLLIQARIFVMLHKQRSDGSVAAIDRLFKTHNYVNMFFVRPNVFQILYSQF